ncbi:MAG: type II secretion system secretin GspD [Gammaproteobacteria bacterium]
MAVLTSACATLVGEPPTPPAPEPTPQITVSPAEPEAPAMEMIPLGDEDGDGIKKGEEKTRVEMFPGTGPVINPLTTRMPPKPGKTASGEYTLNFESTDLQEVVKAILGDLLKENYFIDPKVTGSVTVQTSRPLRRDELLPTLENVLRLNGASLIRTEGLYKIVPSALAARGSASASARRTAAERGFSIRVVPLRFIAARELHKLIEPFLPQDAPQLVDEQRNLLILTGSRLEIESAMELVSVFDVDWLSGMSMALFHLKNSDVKSLHGELEKVFGAKDNPLATVLRMVPIERLNALLVVSPRPAYLEHARVWIERLDQVGESVEPRLYVYRVQNGKAKDLAEVLGGIFGAESKGGTAGTAPPPELAPGESAAELESDTPAGPEGAGGPTLGSGRRTGQAKSKGGVSAVVANETLRIIADETNNALLILARPEDYKMIMAALKRLDIVPLQVFIEASVIEVTLTDNLQYGVEWFFNSHFLGHSSRGGLNLVPGGGSDTSGSGNGNNASNNRRRIGFGDLGLAALGGQGFSYGLLNGAGEISLLIRALAEESKVKVLQSPSLMVLDNQTALIKVVNQIPVVTQQQQAIQSQSNLLSNVEFKDAGVILEVTPRVNAGGRITLDLNQEVTDVGAPVAPSGNRSFLQRNIQSKVSVQSGETIVIGGLIRENKTDSDSGIPILKDIPVMGALFGPTVDNTTRTELIVLLTPQAVRDLAESRAVTDEFRDRLQQLEAVAPGG